MRGFLQRKGRWIKFYFTSNRFQNILSLSFAAVLIIGLGSVVVISYLRYTEVFQSVIKQKNIQILDQTNQYMDTYLRNMMKISDSLYYQAIKNNDFNKKNIDYELKLFYNSNQDKIVSIALFDFFGEVINAAPLANLKQNSDVRKQHWFQKARANIENLVFSAPHVQNLFNDDSDYRWVVSLARSIEIMRGKEVQRGVLLLDMNFNGIEQVCKSVSLGQNSYMYLMDKDGEIIYHPRLQLIYAGIEEESNKQVLFYNDGSQMEDFQNQKRMITTKTVGYTGWKLVAVTPFSDLSYQYLQLQEFTFFIFLIGTLGLLFMTKLVSAKIANPIKELEVTMSEIANGNLDLQIYAHGSYEVAHLGESLNALVKKMKLLLEEAITKESQKRKTELDALQTQINPHFLYNTMDSIIWMIENERYDGAIHMLTALAKFFRITLSKGNNFITVKDEVSHAENYLAIQQIRYKDKFEYEIDVEKEVEGLATLKFIVQPMIENAIYHGLEFMGKDDGGMIRIHAYQKDGDFYIDVIDNGAGISPKELEALSNGTPKIKKKGSGIGMKNVQQRIRLYFGDPYGLQIFSEPDEGTTIQIHLPQTTLEDIEHAGKK